MELKLFNRTVDIENSLIIEDFKYPNFHGYLIPSSDIKYTNDVDFIVKGIFGLFDRNEFDDQDHLNNVNTLNEGLGHKYIELDDYDQYTSLEPQFMPSEFKYKLTNCEVIHVAERDRLIQYLIKNDEDEYFIIADDELSKYPIVYYIEDSPSSERIKKLIGWIESEPGGH